MARPRKPIDGDQVRKLAALGCTQDEIGGWFGVSGDTVARRFAEEIALGVASLKISLRRKQTRLAMGGNVPLLIHLGKQYLGQSDKVEQSGGLTIRVVYVDENLDGSPSEAPPGPA